MRQSFNFLETMKNRSTVNITNQELSGAGDRLTCSSLAKLFPVMMLGVLSHAGLLASSTVSVAVTPTTVTLKPSQSQVFNASVAGTANMGVTWSLSPGVGSLATTGTTAIYTAPTTVSAPQTITITATGIADTTKNASAVISLVPALSITPSSPTLTNSQTVTLNTSGANSSGILWSFSPQVGTFVHTGTAAVYTVPSSLSQSQTIQVKATSMSNSSLIAKAVLILVPTVAISLAPASADLMAGGRVVISPTVTGATDTSVQWSLSPNLGTIDSTGLYIAPASLTQDTTVTVTAMAQANPAKKALVPIRLHANGLTFTTNANGLQSVVFNGIDYNYVYGEGLLSLVYTQPPNGSITQYTPKCSATYTSTTVSQNCVAGGDSFALTVSYSVPSSGTLQAQIAFTNNSVANTVTNAMVSTLGVHMSQFDTSIPVAALSESNPLSIGSFITGRFAIWNNTPGPAIGFNQACGWTYICKNQPEFLNVAPGHTATASFSLRFTNEMTASALDLAPEAYAAYRAAYPYVVNWPDRRPISLWFMSDHDHQSVTNPRGYLNDPSIDASNISAFQSKVLANAQSIINLIKSRPVQPQGIVLWDLEGQEFSQPTTYIGDPRVLSQGYAPEMNATADQLFALFKNAGLKVGITLRPDYLQWGPSASLPATCNFNSNNNYKDYYIAVDAPFLKRFNACYSTNKWSIIPDGNGAQTVYQPSQVQQVTNLLLAKVAYARARWGTTIYYVDSTVWEGGAPITADIFRALQLAYPDSLFMPEESYVGTLAAAIPYASPNGALNSLFAPVTWRFAYPNGAQATNYSNCVGTCWTADAAGFGIGQKIGDIALYGNPSQLSTSQLGAIESMILQARSEAGSIAVTDSSTGNAYSYTGTPATVYQYPVKMRVYFADSAADLASSSTYCENGSWLGTNSCTLNLAGLTVAQIRYYDFEGKLVLSQPSGQR
jgi:hypothetical protein